MGAFREVTEAEGCIYDHIRKVLPGSGPGSATLWGRNMGAVGRNDQQDRGGTRGFPTTSDGDEGAKAVRDVSGKCPSGDTFLGKFEKGHRTSLRN